MKLGGHEYMMVQQIYTTFGPAASVLEPGAIVVSAVLAFLVRRRWPPFALTFGTAVAGRGARRLGCARLPGESALG